MPTLLDVYCKFGEAAEAAQLLETELGNMLLISKCIDEDLLESKNLERAADILAYVNRHTLGQILKTLKDHTQSPDDLDLLLGKARDERNRLCHSFYRDHNFRRNSEAGRAVMLRDLEAIHAALLDAYKAIMLVRGVDLASVDSVVLPTRHVRI